MVRVLIPTGALGLAYDRAALARGVANRPDIIAVDGGSTDSGPSYLGRGVSKYSRSTTRAEWRDLMLARAEAGVPLVIGTAGTCGADSAVDWLYEITCELAAELGQKLRVARLYSGQSPDAVADAMAAGRVKPLSGAPGADAETLRSCANIVALAGAEQIRAAIDTGADIVIAGRTTDTAIIAALPIARNCDAGGAWHGAKVGECGALATTNPASGVIQIDFDETGFTLEPLGGIARATPYTVSAHMLYENTDPFILYEPGGHLDVTGSRYVALDDRRVRVEGSVWVPGPYTVKLEGARIAGYQAVSLTLLRDRRYVENARTWAEDIAARCRKVAVERTGLTEADFTIEMRLVGQDATLGPLETGRTVPTEVGVLAIVTAPTEPQAVEIAKILNPYLLHHALTEEEPMPTFAFPFSPAEMSRGAIYEFCLHHVMTLDNPMSAFRLEVSEVGHG
ncbi:acyclic terpene utilization AtuA family protein [Albidovulum sp.]|uniref:acyclic terpene utilization AtuA family protein n=1 Tax=Albidovulum sp. TaxID=1872424 RepID=UPI001DB56F4B|nr:acyclic terpene utilization AtuA family protein [Paracoccaceae bacterium]MCC0045658.1 acyclic terpene utilization AtuA family protein [Defluviimonas sp.]HRV61806.1 acyclic terpene utilization AtuA family protein [Albidovulum sp.]MCB2122243.1 acyclic terpene utilization AtuA family protein [Paracoccaceae bacterium]MCB2150994.1 acyclic terpene utilization AtuA family protein [Paracoccaceae bacterium]